MRVFDKISDVQRQTTWESIIALTLNLQKIPEHETLLRPVTPAHDVLHVGLPRGRRGEDLLPETFRGLRLRIVACGEWGRSVVDFIYFTILINNL